MKDLLQYRGKNDYFHIVSKRDFDEFLDIYTEFFNTPAKTWGVFEDFMECLKLYDKDQNGKITFHEFMTWWKGKDENYI
jgi:Ca2+-binding EF-hand superfamily protein